MNVIMIVFVQRRLLPDLADGFALTPMCGPTLSLPLLPQAQKFVAALLNIDDEVRPSAKIRFTCWLPACRAHTFT